MTHRSRFFSALASFVVATTAVTVARQPKPSAVQINRGVHGFSVALVLGDLQGSTKADNMPAAAKKALADMRDFLPYRSYRLLDTQWILCCGSTKAGTGISGRLRGVNPAGNAEEPEYPFTVSVVGATGPQLSVRFIMTDAGSGSKTTFAKKPSGPAYKDPPPDQEQHVKPQSERQAREMQRRVDEVLPYPGGMKGAIIDSTFSMDIGETVVIGTSSLKGDKALIALLTAARRPTAPALTLGGKR